MSYIPPFQSRSILIIGIILASLITLFAVSNNALANDQAVTLSYFFAEPLANGDVHIEWETGTEQDTAFFCITRAISPTIPSYPDDIIELDYLIDTNTFTTTSAISGLGTPSSGATYISFDRNTQAGKTYIYQLAEKDLSGNVKIEAKAVVTIGDVASPDFVMTPHNSLIEAPSPSHVITHSFTVLNTGNRRTTMRADITSSPWQSKFASGGQTFLLPALNPNQSLTLQVVTTVPSTITGCGSNVATFSVESVVFAASKTISGKAITKLPGSTLCIFVPIINNN